MNVEVRIIVRLPGYGIYVSAELLGQSRHLLYDGHALTLTYPGATDAFQVDGTAFSPTWTGFDSQSEQVVARLIEQVRVDIAYTIGFELNDFVDPRSFEPRRPMPQRALDELTRICTEGHQIVERFVVAFCAQVRTTLHHDFLGMSSDVPTFVGPVSVVDVVTQRELPFHSIKWRSYAEIVGSQKNMTVELLDDLEKRIVAGQTPTLAREMVYDALFLGRVRHPPDLRLSVLCIAIGVESETFTALRTVCPPQARSLLDYLLATPRDFTTSMSSHLDRTMKAVCGHSLRTDDGALYKGAIRLFEIRNAIAHGRGDELAAPEMVQAVKDGVEVYRWLHDLPIRIANQSPTTPQDPTPPQ